MAGGIGSRFWPMSRTSYPKQFIDFLGVGRTLLQLTFDRLVKIVPKENIFIVTNSEYENLVTAQLPEITQNQILLEPSRKNTAPCIAYATYKISLLNKDASILIAPSDHLILKENIFCEMAEKALQHCTNSESLLTFGINPTRPDTGYGYIQFDDKHPSYNSEIKKVKTFTEKPNLEIAKQFIENGDFVWNSGMFIWNVKSIIAAFEKFMPEMANQFNDFLPTFLQNEKESVDAIYNECKSISIDYGIMEKADNVFVISADIGWSDLGTWGSIYTHLPHDENENAVIRKKILLYESSNCIVNIPKNKLAVIQGLHNYIVVDTKEVLLICKKDDEQKIKDFVNDIKLKKWDKYL
jgi:mannose-1-phosphate guanylyltransferase